MDGAAMHESIQKKKKGLRINSCISFKIEICKLVREKQPNKTCQLMQPLGPSKNETFHLEENMPLTPVACIGARRRYFRYEHCFAANTRFLLNWQRCCCYQCAKVQLIVGFIGFRRPPAAVGAPPRKHTRQLLL